MAAIAQLAAEACPYANICEQCDNYVSAPEFIPSSRPSSPTSPRSTTAPPNAAGTPESPATHASSQASRPCNDFSEPRKPDTTSDSAPEGRLIERWFAELTNRKLHWVSPARPPTCT